MQMTLKLIANSWVSIQRNFGKTESINQRLYNYLYEYKNTLL